MKFDIDYWVGSHLRTKRITAKDLDDAELIANDRGMNWENIIMVDKTKGEIVSM